MNTMKKAKENNRTNRTTRILHTILRALVCLVLLMVCVPVAGETVSAATTYTEYGKLVLSASKKKGEVYTDKGFPVYARIYTNTTSDKWDIPDDTYYFTTTLEGTMTVKYSAKNVPDNDCAVFKVYDAKATDGILILKGSVNPSTTGATSGSDSISTVLSPGTYIISSYVPKKASATLSIYFLPTVNSITLPDITLQTGDSISLKDFLAVNPAEYLNYCDSQATWNSDNGDVAVVNKKGEVTAKSAGTATITMENPDGTTVSSTITVTEPVEDAIEITPTTVQLSKETYTYNGKTKEPKVTVLDQDGNEIPSDLVTVNYCNNTDAGTAEALVTVNADTRVLEDGSTYVYHAATFAKTYTIKAAKAKKVTVPKSSITYKYSADGQNQNVTVYDSKGKKIGKSHYTVSYSNTCHAGKVTVKVKMDENYGSKTLKTTYTIKVNSKTAKLFPNRTYFKYAGDANNYYNTVAGVSRSFSYRKQNAKTLKKLLPYGDLDIELDMVDHIAAYYNRTLYREIGGYKEQWGTGDPLKFTGTVGDLIQCCIRGKITKVEDFSNSYEKEYEITCDDGTWYRITYGGMLGLKSGYMMMWIEGNCPTTFAYIKP